MKLQWCSNSALLADVVEGGKKPKTGRYCSWDPYSDDGLVVTLDIREFFDGIAEYKSFFQGGARAYFSLTVDGQEAFQYVPFSKANLTDVGDNITCLPVYRPAITSFISMLFEEASCHPFKPIALGSVRRKTGLLYPMFECTMG
jgi:hypothetical protein